MSQLTPIPQWPSEFNKGYSSSVKFLTESPDNVTKPSTSQRVTVLILYPHHCHWFLWICAYNDFEARISTLLEQGQWTTQECSNTCLEHSRNKKVNWWQVGVVTGYELCMMERFCALWNKSKTVKHSAVDRSQFIEWLLSFLAYISHGINNLGVRVVQMSLDRCCHK